MAVRTTATAVKGIVKVKAVHDVTPFIEAASSLVDAVCTKSAYTTEKFELIERWLSAHFYCIAYSRSLQQQAGGVMQTVQSKVDLGLDLTHYGQMAKLLDTDLNLAALSNQSEVVMRVKATLLWLGKANDAL